MATSKLEIPYISASRWDRTEIPTAKYTFSRSIKAMGIIETLSEQTRCDKLNMVASKHETPISQLPCEIAANISMAKPTFLRSRKRTGLVQILSDKTGFSKSNMAASKLEILRLNVHCKGHTCTHFNTTQVNNCSHVLQCSLHEFSTSH